MSDAATAEPGTALALIGPAQLGAAFTSSDMVDMLLAQVEAKVRAHVPDLTTAKGRDAIKSLAYAVSRSKTALDDAGKKLTEDARAQIADVNAQRKVITDRLDALRDEARKPLTDWEAAEESRKAELMRNMQHIEPVWPIDHMPTAEALAGHIASVEAIAIDSRWQEFEDQARLRKDRALAKLRPLHAAAAVREEQAAELAQLRAEAEARRAEDAKRAADEQAKRDADAAAERQRQAAEDQARRDQQAEADRQQAAETARIRAEQAAADRIAAAERATEQARIDAEAATRRAAEQAERDKAAAIEAERRRVDAEREAQERADRKREADRAHVGQIRREAKEALMKIEGIDEPLAVLLVLAIHGNTIPHITIKY